ncbi:helix-turn-helix domain-containing protein [Flavobacterium silvaticum]|uniref:Helix-turn-helix transcriptional regulator n=1 Tax=Flavobacterium silvaticum TaxID=1852020 RepID=A0A972JKT5_9FLAO|nr:response regulator transcription factor [Flavobacterium silvaticum]NMH29457.1 helix-turn-helix transcriptional regulator [Flavobacterium silvaticum]
MKASEKPFFFESIPEFHKVLGLPAPLHPLISINNYKDITADTTEIAKGMILNLYKISYKKEFSGKVKYGQQHYDFDNGGLCFVSPNQLISESRPARNYDGFTLVFHPDFIRRYPLGKKIKDYGFFSYSANEALHLSESELTTLMEIFKHIEMELSRPIDSFSQDIIVAQIELLLHYSDRFYNRQFLTRKAVNHDLLTRLDEVLSDYFDTEKALVEGLPSVHYISDQLKVSPRYLSDMLRSLTGQNTQQHIHNRLIEKAKDILSNSNATISEIAYQLGFEHPQSFNKMFKQKTQLTPVQFKQTSIN